MLDFLVQTGPFGLISAVLGTTALLLALAAHRRPRLVSPAVGLATAAFCLGVLAFALGLFLSSRAVLDADTGAAAMAAAGFGIAAAALVPGSLTGSLTALVLSVRRA